MVVFYYSTIHGKFNLYNKFGVHRKPSDKYLCSQVEEIALVVHTHPTQQIELLTTSCLGCFCSVNNIIIIDLQTFFLWLNIPMPIYNNHNSNVGVLNTIGIAITVLNKYLPSI